MEEQRSFIKGLVFRLVRKHIAGTTVNSVFKVSKELNNKNVQTAITFLSESPKDNTKIRYNLNTYLQVIKQMARLRINGSVSIRCSQLGINSDIDMFMRNMDAMLNTATQANVPIWVEYEYGVDHNKIINIYNTYRSKKLNIGIELPIKDADINSISKKITNNSKIKLLNHSYERNRLPKSKTKIDIIQKYIEIIDSMSSRGMEIWISEPEEKDIYRFVNKAKKYKSNLVFEIPLGYSRKWLAKLNKLKVNLSVYAPYGKDWVPYAIDRLTEGRIRRLAITLLDGKSVPGEVNDKKRILTKK